MKGWILYKKNKNEITPSDHGVNRLLQVAQQKNIKMEVIKPSELDVITTRGKSELYYQQKQVDCPDFVIPRIGAKTSYQALVVLEVLESLGVYTCNSLKSIRLVKDKMTMSMMFAQHNLPTPKTMLLNHPVSFDLIEKEFEFPLVIKNISGAQGVGVYLCESAGGFRDLVSLLDTHQHNEMLIQSFIKTSYGRDLRVFVLGTEVIGCMQRKAKDGFKANFSLGGEVEFYELTPEIKNLALKASSLFGLDIAGIDLLFDKEGFTICEANSSPGFKGMEEATGLDIANLIIDYILNALSQKN